MAEAPRLRTVEVGMSVIPTCGVHAHAGVLSAALEQQGVACTLDWLDRSEASLRSAGSEVRAWTAGLAGDLERERPDAVILHYSVFAFSYRGLPVFVHPVTRVLRRTGIPVISVLHELVYPWNIGGARGKVWAATQRALLLDVISLSSAAIVTADFRAEWLHSRRWLPHRRVEVAPVFSNLPAPSGAPAGERPRGVIGLFGYAYEGAAVPIVLDALTLLIDRGEQVQLRLLGAPGPGSEAAQGWMRAAADRGVAGALSFSGTLPSQEVSDAMAACDALLFIGEGGPSSRKGSLAGSLASGTPVVALDGPRAWAELRGAGAAVIVGRSARELADGLAGLLADEQRRLQVGARGRAFAEDRMGPARTADAVISLLRGL